VCGDPFQTSADRDFFFVDKANYGIQVGRAVSAAGGHSCIQSISIDKSFMHSCIHAFMHSFTQAAACAQHHLSLSDSFSL
jgi:hypothetical protein